MPCNEFDARMQKLLDERRSPELDPILLSHAQRCADCHAQLATLSRLLDSLDLLDVPDVSLEFAQRVVESVNKPTRTSAPMRSSSTWVRVAAAMAATLLLATLPMTWYALSGHRGVAQPTPGIKPFGELNTPDSPQYSPQYSPSAPDVVSDGWLVTSASILELYPEETRQRHRQQVNQIADNLRPIATPFNAAMTAIRRSIPVGKSGPKGEPSASLDRPMRTRNFS